MKSKSFDGMTCSIASVLDALGDRWSALIVRDLALGLARYEDLRRSTDVTHATLSERLKVLEANGLIERRLYQSRPDRYEYHHLTPHGRDIGIVLMALAQVGDAWGLAESKALPLCFTEARSGHAMRLALVDAETGRPLDLPDLRVEAGPGADEIMLWRLEKTRARRRESSTAHRGRDAGYALIGNDARWTTVRAVAAWLGLTGSGHEATSARSSVRMFERLFMFALYWHD